MRARALPAWIPALTDEELLPVASFARPGPVVDLHDRVSAVFGAVGGERASPRPHAGDGGSSGRETPYDLRVTPSLPASVAPRPRAVLLVAAAAVLLAKEWLPFGRYLLFPFTLLTTWVHEMGHGLAAILGDEQAREAERQCRVRDVGARARERAVIDRRRERVRDHARQRIQRTDHRHDVGSPA
jgi:hypothetical protein